MVAISIITINFNNAIGLSKTIESVISQTYNKIEYIIIDGGSSDNSVEIIEWYQNYISYWVSEPDSGIYNAMNKGIRVAKGDYLLFLNSGDFLASKNILSHIKETVAHYDIVYGDFILNYHNHQRTCRFPEKLDFNFFTINSLPHSSTFIRKSLFNSIGLYNESYKIVSDWEFFLLAINKYNCTYLHVPEALSVFDMNGISSHNENESLIRSEREEALKKHFPTFVNNYKELHQLRDELSKLKASKVYRITQKLKRILG